MQKILIDANLRKQQNKNIQKFTDFTVRVFIQNITKGTVYSRCKRQSLVDKGRKTIE